MQLNILLTATRLKWIQKKSLFHYDKTDYWNMLANGE